MYYLEFGTKERLIIDQAMRFGNKIPDRILNSPSLKPHLNLYLTAFFELSTTRSVGMSLGSIPWTAICMYCNHYSFDSEQSELLFFFIGKLDEVYIKFMQET